MSAADVTARGGPGTSLLLDAPGAAPGPGVLPLDLPWSELPPRGSARAVRLVPPATSLPLVALRRAFHRASWLLEVGGRFEWRARDPDAVRAATDPVPWPGERVRVDGTEEFYRPLRHHVELARLFPLELGVPERETAAADASATPFIRCAAERIEEASAIDDRGEDAGTRYGPDSAYRRFDRLEEPEILDDLLHGIAKLRPGLAARILSLGVNDGRELSLVAECLDGDGTAGPELWGIDAAEGAIGAARARFPEHRERFLVADLSTLPDLGLPRFDAVLALGVLQCTTVDRDRLLADLGPLLAPRCGLLLSIPNCHFGSRDILRRPHDRSDRRHDRSPVWKDLRYLTRWCYRAGFDRVETYGTYDAFVLARRRG